MRFCAQEVASSWVECGSEMYAGSELKNVTRMTERNGSIQTEEVGRQYLGVLGMQRDCSGQMTCCKTCKTGWKSFSTDSEDVLIL